MCVCVFLQFVRCAVEGNSWPEDREWLAKWLIYGHFPLRGNNAPKMWHAVTFDNYNNNNNNNGNIEAVRQQQLEYRKAQTNEPEPEYQPECECEPARELRGWGSCNSSGWLNVRVFCTCPTIAMPTKTTTTHQHQGRGRNAHIYIEGKRYNEKTACVDRILDSDNMCCCCSEAQLLCTVDCVCSFFPSCILH